MMNAVMHLTTLSVLVFLNKFVSGQVCVEETLDCSDTVSSIFKVGEDSCACNNAEHAGALKYSKGNLYVCLGVQWARFEYESKVTPEYGTQLNPGYSCKDIHDKAEKELSDGIYWLQIYEGK